METSLETLFNFYVLSTGRRTFALQQMKPIAADLEEKALVTMINRALEHENKTLKLEAAWEASGYNSDPQRVKKVDVKVDRTLTAIRDTASAQARAVEPGEKLHKNVHELLGQIFPAGVNAISSMPYVEELMAVDTIVKQLKGPFASHVQELGLGRLADRLAELAKEYREAQLEKPAGDIDFGHLRAARAKGQEQLLQVVAVVIGTYYGSTPEHTRLRTALLEPFLDQQEAARQMMKSRRPLEDIDPTTGEAKPATQPSLPAGPVVDDN